MTLSPTTPGVVPDTRRLRWRREGWVIHGERAVQMVDGVHLTHADVDLRGPFPLLVRGALVVALDAAALALIWLLAEAIAGMPLAMPGWRRLGQIVPGPGRDRPGRVLPDPGGRLRLLGAFPARPGGGAAARRGDHASPPRRGGRPGRARPRASVPPPLASTSSGRASARNSRCITAARGWRRPIRCWPTSACSPRCRTRRPSGRSRSGARSNRRRRSRCWDGGAGSDTGWSVRETPTQLVVLAAPRGSDALRLAASQADLGWLLLLATLLGLTGALAAARRRRGGAGPPGGGPAALGARPRAGGAAAGTERHAAAGVRAGGRRVRPHGRRHPAEPRGARGVPPDDRGGAVDRLDRGGRHRARRNGAGRQSPRGGTAGEAPGGGSRISGGPARRVAHAGGRGHADFSPGPTLRSARPNSRTARIGWRWPWLRSARTSAGRCSPSTTSPSCRGPSGCWPGARWRGRSRTRSRTRSRRCASASSTCAACTASAPTRSGRRSRKPRSASWRRSSGSTPSRAPSAGSARPRGRASRPTGCSSVRWPPR